MADSALCGRYLEGPSDERQYVAQVPPKAPTGHANLAADFSGAGPRHER